MAKITIETWDPEYGTPLPDAQESNATVNPAVELPVEQWKPIAPADAAPAERVAFIDGVRRIEALVWIQEEGEPVKRGVAASYAAGVVVSQGDRARIVSAEVRRGLFSTAANESLETRAGRFEPRTASDDQLESLSLALQQRLGELEVGVAAALEEGADLVVVDGPLSGRQNVPGAVGYVKTHRVAYLDGTALEVVTGLQPGERTPLFVTTTSWTRYSWYTRLPGPVAQPWAGVVRMEASADLALDTVRGMADVATVTLPAYASVPHKDPRAPQNLFPIGALERELRRRLGDAAFVQRSLRLAAAQ